jgi:hypothetical protein
VLELPTRRSTWTFYSPYSLYADSPWLRASVLFVAFLLVREIRLLCRRLLGAGGRNRPSA